MGLFNLTPISLPIQQRLFDKIKLLGREKAVAGKPISYGGLTHADLASRVPFIKFASGLETPVVLMGGELIGEKVRGGYEDIYGARHYREVTGVKDFENKAKRPMPGVKSIEVTYKGGQRALREATVNWTVWSLEDLDRLTPHFFALGSDVALEWGWVYNKKQFEDLPSFIGKGGVRASIHNNQKTVIDSAMGDMDGLAGIISKFEYTAREDGAFDCTTTILTTGAKIIDTPIPNKNSGKEAVRLDIDKIQEQIQESERKKKVDRIPLILDGDVTLKSVIRHIDEYLADKISKVTVSGTGTSRKSARDGIKKKYKSRQQLADKTEKTYFNYVENEFIIEYTKKDAVSNQLGDRINVVKNAWVKWGWFEDNILSKFLSIIGKDEKIPMHEFRSIRKVFDSKGGDTGGYESNRVRNHKFLETVAPNRYILPGQFKPLNPPLEDNQFVAEAFKGDFKGDSEAIKNLAKIANNNFNAFTTATDETTEEVTVDVFEERKGVFKLFGRKKVGTETVQKPSGFKPTPGNHGYIRNMLINTDLIKQAFGVTDDSVESLNINEFLSQLFVSLNQPLDFWSLEATTDTFDSYRIGIVDTSLSVELPPPGVSVESTQTQTPASRSTVNSNNQVQNNGVFFFPTWNANSIVKSQNITVSPPTALQLSLMYGSNADKMKTLQEDPAGTGDAINKALGASASDPKNPSKIFDDLDMVLFKNGYKNYGSDAFVDDKKTAFNEGGKADKFLSRKKGDNLIGWITNNLSLMGAETKDEIEERVASEKAAVSVNSDSNKAVEEIYEEILDDPKVIPPPLPEELTPRQYANIVGLHYTLADKSKEDVENLQRLYTSKFTDERVMKSKFIDSVSFRTSIGKRFAEQKTKRESDGDKDQSVKLPFKLELEIDGIGGIYPGNSCHSTYMQKIYKDRAVFQVIDVGDTVDSTGWTTTLTCIMRSSPSRLVKLTTKKITTIKEIRSIDDQFKKYKEQQIRDKVKKVKDD